MSNFFLYIITPFVSFISGFTAYVVTLKLAWGESLNGDVAAVLFGGGIAFYLLAVPIYFGIIYFINRTVKKFKIIYYPVGCMLVFFLPTSFITLTFGSTNLFSAEAMLFHSFFLVSGLIFGLSVGGIQAIKSKS